MCSSMFSSNYIKRQVRSCLVFVFLVLGVILYSGCTTDANQSSGQDKSSIQTGQVEEWADRESNNGNSIEEIVSRSYGDAEDYITERLNERMFATPIIAEFGEEVPATDRVTVSVLSAEPGPYDYADNNPTVKVTVRMTNTSNRTYLAKASNWDADTNSGLRVDHKYWVCGEDGKKQDESFTIVKISPGKSFEGILFFDGEELDAVVYEPHWVVSGENEYIYFVESK